MGDSSGGVNTGKSQFSELGEGGYSHDSSTREGGSFAMGEEGVESATNERGDRGGRGEGSGVMTKIGRKSYAIRSGVDGCDGETWSLFAQQIKSQNIATV